MKQFFIFLCIVSFTVAGCNKESSGVTDKPFAEVSFYAAIPDAPELSFFLNGYNVAVNVPYGSYTLYNPVSGENVAMRVQSPSRNISIDTSFSVVESGYYSAFLTGAATSVTPYILRDSFPTPDSGYCGLRFFVFASGASAIDLHLVNSDTTFNETGWVNRSYGENIASDTINTFKKFAQGTYSFYAISKTNNKDTIKLGSKTFSDSSNYSLMLEGHIATGDTSLLLGSRLH